VGAQGAQLINHLLFILCHSLCMWSMPREPQLLPAQIVRSGRKIIYRIMGYSSWLKDFFAAWENLRRMAPA
jgi:hypothetical protein